MDDRRLTLCHYAPLAIVPQSTIPDKKFCSQCGDRDPLFVIRPEFDAAGVIEMAVRRYKEGDADFQTTSAAIGRDFDRQLQNFIDGARVQVYDGSPPAWIRDGRNWKRVI